MEKEIYLTEAPCNNEFSDNNHAFRQKTNITPFQTRPDTPKMTYKKQIDKIPLENYYDDLKFKPGICFYKTILQIEEKRVNGQYNGPLLELSIPDTVLLNENSNSMIYQKEGIVKVESFVSNEIFVHRLLAQKQKECIQPVLIHSSVSGITFSNTIMMNNQILSNKIIPRSQSFIVRKFIPPFGNYPNIFRLFYISKNAKKLKKNYGYKYVSQKAMDEQLFKKKHRLVHNYLINVEKEETYTTTLVKGQALSKCEEMAESLLNYFEKGVNIKISEMVIDFVVDKDKKIWFHDLISIKNKVATKLWDIGTSEEVALIAQQNINSTVCKLCGMTYSRHEIQKIVTNKLILQLVCHLKNRGVELSGVPHLKNQGLSYVCNLCYDVIVAQHKLINVEKQFSNILNICQDSIERVFIPQQQKNKNQPYFFKEDEFNEKICDVPVFKTWRLFFYVQKIKNFVKYDNNKNFNISLEISFKNLKQKFTKIIKSEEQDQSKIFQSRYSAISRVQSAKLKKISNTDKLNYSMVHHNLQISKNTIDKSKVNDLATQASKLTYIAPQYESFSIQKVKMYIFYTKKHQATHSLANTTMNFTLHINDQKFTGSSLTLQELKNSDTCQRHSSQIFLFDEKLKYCNLELTVGLICDGQISCENLDLEETEGIFFPTKPFSSCKPLSDEWMEVFTKGEELPELSKEMTYEQIKRKQLQKQSRIIGSHIKPSTSQS